MLADSRDIRRATLLARQATCFALSCTSLYLNSSNGFSCFRCCQLVAIECIINQFSRLPLDKSHVTPVANGFTMFPAHSDFMKRTRVFG